MFGKKIEHPSFGNVVVSRISSGTGINLFGSDAEHRSFMHVEVRRAEIHEDRDHDFVFGTDSLVDFWLTDAQWAHLVSAVGNGTGTPVTLRRTEREVNIPLPPKRADILTRHENAGKETVQKMVSRLTSSINRISAMLEGATVKKGELRESLSDLQMARQEIQANLPFVEKCFGEKLEQMTNSAIIEFEAHVQHAIHQRGLEAMREDVLRLAAPKEEPKEFCCNGQAVWGGVAHEACCPTQTGRDILGELKT